MSADTDADTDMIISILRMTLGVGSIIYSAHGWNFHTRDMPAYENSKCLCDNDKLNKFFSSYFNLLKIMLGENQENR